MSRFSLFASIPLFLAGCPQTVIEGEFTVDQKIDGVADDDTRIQSVEPQMCVNSLGHVFVLWMDNREAVAAATGPTVDDKVVLWMNRSLSKGDPDTWLPAPARVNQGAGDVFNPKMVCNDNGAYVVWEDNRDGELQNHNIYFQRSVDGETWLAEDVLVDPDPQGDTFSISPDLAIDASNNLYVVWADNQSGSYDILLSTSNDNGATWQAPSRVDQDFPGDAWSGQPDVAVDAAGLHVYVAWEDKRDGKSDIYFTYSETAGASFRAEERLDTTLADPDGATSSFDPTICTDGTGPVYVVWHDAKNGTGYDIYYNYAPDQGATFFPAAVRLESDTAGQNNSQYPKCSAIGSKLHVAWQDNRFIGYDAFYRSITDGIVDPTEEIRLDVGTLEGAANSLEVQLARFDNTVVVGWTDGRAEAEANVDNPDASLGYDDVYYNFADNGGRFDAEKDYRVDSLLPGQSYKENLSIGLLGGEVYAAWEDGRGGTSDIYFQRHLLGSEGAPPPVEDDGAAE